MQRESAPVSVPASINSVMSSRSDLVVSHEVPTCRFGMTRTWPRLTAKRSAIAKAVSFPATFGWYVRKDDSYGVTTEPLSAEEGRFRLEGLFLAQ